VFVSTYFLLGSTVGLYFITESELRCINCCGDRRFGISTGEWISRCTAYSTWSIL